MIKIDEISGKDPTRKTFHLIALATTLVILFISRFAYNFLLFHFMAEIFSITIAVTIFLFGWNSFNRLPNSFFKIISVSFMFTGLLTVLHTATYKGMGLVPGLTADTPTQLWISSQFMQAASFVIGFILFNRKIHKIVLLGIYIFITGVLFHAIFLLKIFPACFSAEGLTPFKITMEYVICVLFIVSLIILFLKRSHFHKSVFTVLFISIILSIAGELVFTLYTKVDDNLNFAGHFLRIISLYLIYWSVFVTGVQQPFSIVFRNLKEHEIELTKALSRVKQLQGLLPICSSCKKIRDDKGYWNQIEEYISDHSEAEFSHGLCPACFKKYDDMISDLPDKKE